MMAVLRSMVEGALHEVREEGRQQLFQPTKDPDISQSAVEVPAQVDVIEGTVITFGGTTMADCSTYTG